MKKLVLFLLAAALSFISLYAKEIKSGEGDGIVRHRDMILQDARPGDYLYQNKGKNKKVLEQVDIDYSKNEYDKILKSLLDERPGSIRAIIAEIVEDIGIDLPYPESKPEDVDIHYLNELSGKGVIEYVSSINNRKQIITVIVRKPQDLSYFTSKYKTPPWSSKTLSGGTPSTIIFAKKVNSNENVCMSFNENIEETKRHLAEERMKSKLTIGKVDASQEYGQAININWSKNASANKYRVLIKDKSKKIVDSQIVTNTHFSYIAADGFKYPAYISVAAMKDDISGDASNEVKVKKPKAPKNSQKNIGDFGINYIGFSKNYGTVSAFWLVNGKLGLAKGYSMGYSLDCSWMSAPESQFGVSASVYLGYQYRFLTFYGFGGVGFGHFQRHLQSGDYTGIFAFHGGAMVSAHFKGFRFNVLYDWNTVYSSGFGIGIGRAF